MTGSTCRGIDKRKLKTCESLQVFCVFKRWRPLLDSRCVAFDSTSTMAAGSRKKFALDLNDIFAFPDGDNIPLRPPNTEEGESWVMLLEVGLLCCFKRGTL